MSGSPIRHPASWAAAAPMLCALHCVSMPLLVALVPALAPAAEWEMLLFVLTSLLVAGVLGHAVRSHRRAGPALVAAAGLVGWFGSLSDWFAPVPEAATTVVASLVVAGAVLWNTTLLHRVRHPSCSCSGCMRRRPDVPGRGAEPLPSDGPPSS